MSSSAATVAAAAYTNVLSNFFARDPTKDFGFEIFDKPTTTTAKKTSSLDDDDEDDFFVFLTAKARRKISPHEIFKAFVCDLKIAGTSQDDLTKAKFCAKKLKTLRHPAFLTFIDSCEVSFEGFLRRFG
uniref:Uncharacterized protein n=1 Tax=Romanomermis culicivorax TaxID=13658 RepID=A0A915IUK3_ROMCU